MTQDNEAERLLAWINDRERKPAELAFTAGPLRQVADYIATLESINTESDKVLDALKCKVHGRCVPGALEQIARLREAAGVADGETA